MKQISFKIGEKNRVKSSFFMSMNLVYCGMPTDKTFSLGLREGAGYQGYGLNLYFPINSHTINIGNIKFQIIKVTPEELILEQME